MERTKKSYVRDMTVGSVMVHMIAFSLPMLAGNLFQQLYNMVDSIVVGRFVGANALGAVGSVGSLNFLCFSLCLGLSNGIGILVSQFFGAGEDETVKKYIAHAVYVILAAGMLMSVVGFVCARPILVMMKTPAEAFADALCYMRIVCGFSVVVAVFNGISAILRALGDSKTPLIFLVIASFVNIILDIVFVVYLHMDVAGAAYATIISQGIAAGGSVLWGVRTNPYLRLRREHFNFDLRIVKREFVIGVPLSAQAATIAVSCIALQSVVNRFGATIMAAYTASNRIEQLVQQPFNSLGMASSTIAGQNYGAGKKDRIYNAAKSGTLINVLFSALMIVVMYTLGNDIVGVFISDPEVIEIGARGLRITSCLYVFLGMIYVFRGMLNGVGDVNFSMMNGIAEVICRISFALLLIGMFNFDYMAAWYTNGLTWTFVGLFSVLRFYQAKWTRKR